MVQWKGELNGEVGGKAHNLDELDEFNVPNFFVITPEEVEELFRDVKGKDQVLNSQVKGEIRNKIKEAYEDIGVSSEVRNAVGKAKSLVGGQRSNPLVSVRVSDRAPGEYSHELNVGSSNLFEAIKTVASSYYEKNKDQPAIIVQKMVEPDHTGAVITDYGKNGLVEIVDGLGTALEEGSETPHLYLIGRQGIVEKRINREQNRVERNPINGNKQRKNSGDLELDDKEVKDLFGKAASREINVKFAYNRGTFHVVDAWRAEREQDLREIESLKGIKIGDGSIDGEVGKDVKFTEKPLAPEKYRAMVSRNGGYTTRNAQKARKNDKIAVLSYSGNLDNGQRVEINDRDIINVNGEGPDEKEINGGESQSFSGSPNYSFNQVLASKILPIDPSQGDGLYTGSVFNDQIRVVENGEKDIFRDEEIVDSYRDVFSFDGDSLLLDLREIDHGKDIIDYLDAGEKVLLVDSPKPEVLQEAVDSGYKKFAVPGEEIERFRNTILKAEKRFLMEKLREK